VQEVYWRTYWKGWLEMRPGVWADYRRDLDARWRGWTAIMPGRWAGRVGRPGSRLRRLGAGARDTGYLSNHARMWTASIWIFTLRLPWEVGADWFLRHLLDGDPASNTLELALGGGAADPRKGLCGARLQHRAVYRWDGSIPRAC
jgi:deoxyribodipyrimidine photo-lyase